MKLFANICQSMALTINVSQNWPNRKAILWGKTIRCFVGLFLSFKFFGNSHGVIQCTPVDITFISTSFLFYFVDFVKDER